VTEITLEDPKYTLDQTIKKLSNYGNGLDQNAYYYLMLLNTRMAKRDEEIITAVNILGNAKMATDNNKDSHIGLAIDTLLSPPEKPQEPPPKAEKLAAEFRKAEKQMTDNDLKDKIEKAKAKLLEIFEIDYVGDTEPIYDGLNELDDILAGRK